MTVTFFLHPPVPTSGRLVAPFSRRVFAWGADLLIVALAFASLSGPVNPATFLGLLVAYHTLLLWLTEATVGKALLGLKVERLSGHKVTLLWALGRSSLGYFIVDVLGIGTLFALLTRDHRCLHDFVFGSTVWYRGHVTPFGKLITGMTRYLKKEGDALTKKMKEFAVVAAFFDQMMRIASKIEAVTRKIGDWLGYSSTGSSTAPSAAGAVSLKAAAAVVSISGALTVSAAQLPPVRAALRIFFTPHSWVSLIAGTNLVINPSFEHVSIVSPFNSNNPADIPGWTHSGSVGDALVWRIGYSDPGGAVTVAGEGKQFVTMGAGYQRPPATSTWSQTLNGLAAGTYRLAFKLAREGEDSGTQSVRVHFSGASDTEDQVFTASQGQYWGTWEEKSTTFHVTGGSVTMSFSANTSFDVGLDDVRVKVVF